MSQVHAFIIAAALVLATSAHAHDCSGGTDGGMDATGNECNQPAPIVAAAQTPAKPVAARPTKAAARRATNPCNARCAASDATRRLRSTGTLDLPMGGR